ncbi:MAG TPA: hypothetical protein VGM06_25530 [Polyangiaceae bacterium]|jgi:hypothetical protein
MPDSLTLIVLVAAGGSSGGTDALLQAAHESLGSETRIDVRETPHEPTDLDALSTERREHADAVAELSYKDRKRRQVTLRVHVGKQHRWLERTLVFDPADVEVERARTLGYAMAAILPEPFPHHREEPKPPPEPEPPSPPPAPPPPPPPPPPPKSEVTAAAPIHAPRPRRFAVELLAIAGTGVDSGADEGGGEIAGQVHVLPPVSLRVGGGVESGSIGLVEVKTTTFFWSLGVVLHALRPTGPQPLGISVRADYLHSYNQGTHDADPPRNQELNGVDAVGEVGWLFVQGLEAVAGLGVEGMFPPIKVTVHDPDDSLSKSSTTPVFRVIGEVGLRLSF